MHGKAGDDFVVDGANFCGDFFSGYSCALLAAQQHGFVADFDKDDYIVILSG